jgi:GTP-binding protein HflX
MGRRAGSRSGIKTQSDSQGSVRAHRGRVDGDSQLVDGREPRGPGERAFLVGVEFRSRRGVSPGRATTPQATLARSASNTSAHPQSDTDAGKRASAETIAAEETLAELRELAASAGAQVVGEEVQRRDRPEPATLIGRGKLEEVGGAAAATDAALIIFDHELSPSQQRNIENAVNANRQGSRLRVIDRTQLILDIFARHARTREGQLQVELAQLDYLLPRLAGHGREMSQLGGGIGTRGPGETQLETDRRRIYRRIRFIQQQLEHVRRSRSQQRQRRESLPVATVALVGYTNAGKSTLFNALTRAGVLESAKMFATLDPTIRAVTLPSRRKVLLSDTVGFIRQLPHALVSAFRATLEEVQRAALILQVSDVTSPAMREQDAQVEQVLHELEADRTPRLRVLNKIDLLPPEQHEQSLSSDDTLYVSAARGTGLEELLARIDARIAIDPVSRVRLRVPQSEGKVLALLEARARILSRRYHAGTALLEAEVPQSVLRQVSDFAY